MKKEQLNEVARFQAIAGIQAVGSLREDMAAELADDDSDAGGMDAAALQAKFFPGHDVGDMDNPFFIDLLNSLADYFGSQRDALGNIKGVDTIVRNLSNAASIIQGRSGN